MNIENLAKKAYIASTKSALLPAGKKNYLLLKIADAIEAQAEEIVAANRADLAAAEDKSLPSALLDRLALTAPRFAEMVNGVREVAALADPVGRILDGYTTESGLRVMRRSVPFGVVGVIYEARPNVTADVAALCLKSGNASILRGGSEAISTNKAIHKIMRDVLAREEVDPAVITFIDSTNRDDVKELLSLDKYIDVIIPRGGEALHRLCQRESTIPVIVGGFGICHIFVDESANLEKSLSVIINSKVQKPSACNALDTLLVHRKVAEKFFRALKAEIEKHSVELAVHGENLMNMLNEIGYRKDLLAEGEEADFDREWLSLKMNVAVVESLDDVLLHMRAHRATHSDAIMTENIANARRFTENVGSACAYVNAATRFTDGGQFGLGAEVAVSTQKLHVRGPMGLEALTTYAYILEGDYLSRK